ncbi:hypothetical protein M1L60_24800 [Actinoplanes sp. TRM 88003]|uniref:DUF402 domain-containing protein n=1 Tax=Paractinoplanes aksuensis TaxID=2939490 RepID=A0ABT1DSK6_9ACTN|nr:hypothetical protein [Actinoplanes aksuensis]MCO8273822.1 hypothetical protein [Actinoplanes aksuensis]
MGFEPFIPGSTVVRRDVLSGRIWTAAPHRVLADDGDRLVLVTWPGTAGFTPVHWIRWFTEGVERARQDAVADLVSGRWELGRWVWRDTVVVTWVGIDPDFNLQAYLPVAGGPPLRKINFERPVRRTPDGIDTFDLLLDLVADPAGGWRWKDLDEYEQIRRGGLVSEAEDERVQAARQRAMAFAEAGQGPLAEDWTGWPVPDDWALPVLPEGMQDLASSVTKEVPDDVVEQTRRGLVEQLVASGWVADPRVTSAFASVPRHLFAPDGVSVEASYANDVVVTQRGPDGRATSSISAPWLSLSTLAVLRSA